MARYHNRYKPHRNPAPLLLMGTPAMPLLLAAGGLYLLAKGAQRNPGNPVSGGLGEMGSIFSNILHAVDSGMVKSVKVASSVIWQPLQISYDVAIKGQSARGAFQNALNQTKSTVESIAHSASPNAIRNKGGGGSPAAAACGTPNVYTDANGNALTYAQYVGLMQAQGLTPANDDCSGSADAVPPAADPDLTQTSNSVIGDPNQPGGLPGAPGAGGKGKGGKKAAATSGMSPLAIAGGGVGAVALLYFMNK